MRRLKLSIDGQINHMKLLKYLIVKKLIQIRE
ncbi:hypothetical protein J2Z35_002700 [Acetoanaerobium pronyense]|uniref:Uncharacterized protein n=1 Tax=Acetoanaerobium pronyense TaxID=1482736 RepID=A0ABS4KM46_9FIRM|nr:hypothetical protein [Acetoanaerobium pronyense]